MAAEDVKPSAAAVKLEKNFSQVILTLENVLIAPTKVGKSPSAEDGLDAETEKDLRILGTELIQIAGMLLKLPQTAMATGCVLFQRFYYSKSFVKHTMEIVAMGCTNLAAKIEEAPRRPRDVINVFHHIKQVRAGRTISPLILNQDYITLKNNVIKAERRVLKELGFCVHVKHPHKMIIMYLEILNCKNNKTLVQKSWNYMNDSLRTNVFVRYSPETIACACVYLAARQLEIPLPNRPHWFLIFDATEEDVQDISLEVLSLYNRPKVSYDALEKVVNEAKQIQIDAKAKAKGGGVGIKDETASPSSHPATPNKKFAVKTEDGVSPTTAPASGQVNAALNRALARLKKEEDSGRSSSTEGRSRDQRQPHQRNKDGRGAGKGGRASSRSSSRSPTPRRPRDPSNSRSPSPLITGVVKGAASSNAGDGAALGPSPKLPRSYLSPRTSRSPKTSSKIGDENDATTDNYHRRSANNDHSSQSPSPKRPKKYHPPSSQSSASLPSSGSKKDRLLPPAGGGGAPARDAISMMAAAAALVDDDDDNKDHRSRSRPTVTRGRSRKDGGGGGRNDDYYQDRKGGGGRSGGGGGYSPRSPIADADYSPNYNRNKKTSSSTTSKKTYYKSDKGGRNYGSGGKISMDDLEYSSSKDRSGVKSKKSHKNGHSKERYGRDGGDNYGGSRDYYRDDLYVKHKR